MYLKLIYEMLLYLEIIICFKEKNEKSFLNNRMIIPKWDGNHSRTK